MTNNDELALKLKSAAEKALPAIEKYEAGEIDGDDALEMLSDFTDVIKPANILALLAERDADKKRIADLEIKIQRQKDKLQRMASKTITIGLKPMRIEGGAYCSAHAYYDKNGEYLSLDDVEKKCAAAGIKLEVGE